MCLGNTFVAPKTFTNAKYPNNKGFPTDINKFIDSYIFSISNPSCAEVEKIQEN